MRYFYALLCVLSALCAGCFTNTGRPDPTIFIHAETSFTEAERNCINSGAEAFSKQTGYVANVGIVYDYQPSCEVCPNEKPDIRLPGTKDYRLERWLNEELRTLNSDAKAFKSCLAQGGTQKECAGTQIYGQLVSPDDGVKDALQRPVTLAIVADRVIPGPNYLTCKSVVMHELGHFFAMGHSKSPTDLMYKHTLNPPTVCLSDNDIKAFCELNGCSGAEPKVVCE